VFAWNLANQLPSVASWCPCWWWLGNEQRVPWKVSVRVCHGTGKNLASVSPWHVHVWTRAKVMDQNIDIPAQL
jgi:hypothetical protein